jgi:hypothetical protein
MISNGSFACYFLYRFYVNVILNLSFLQLLDSIIDLVRVDLFCMLTTPFRFLVYAIFFFYLFCLKYYIYMYKYIVIYYRNI